MRTRLISFVRPKGTSTLQSLCCARSLGRNRTSISWMRSAAFAFLSCLFISGCRPSPGFDGTSAAGVCERGYSANNAYFRGQISDISVDAFEEKYSHRDVRTLIIDSYGGDTRAAIRLARFVLSRDIVVVVEDVCFSGCLSFVLAAAESIEVCENAAIGTHGGTEVPLYFIRQNKRLNAYVMPDGRVLGAVIFEDLQSIHEEELSFWSDAGINPEFFRCAAVFARPNPPIITVGASEKQTTEVFIDEMEQAYEGVPKIWAPTSRMLNASGFPEVIGWSDDDLQIKDVWRDKLPSETISTATSGSLMTTGVCGEARNLFGD